MIFLLGLFDRHEIQAVSALFFVFAAAGVVWFLAYFVHGMVVRNRRAETLKVTLEGLKTIFALIWLGLYCLIQLAVWLIIAGVAVLIVVGVIFIIIKGIKFVWYF